MIPRPKKTDTMEDVLAMEKDYRQQKSDSKFKPAAEAINKKQPESKQSVFARSRNIKHPEVVDSSSKATEVIGDVVERSGDDMMEVEEASGGNSEGFPQPQLIDSQSAPARKKKSLFSQMSKPEEPAPTSSSDFHNDNLRILAGMSEDEILSEQAKLLKSLDPKLIDFVKSKRKAKDDPASGKSKIAAAGDSPIKSQEEKTADKDLKSEKARFQLPPVSDLPVIDFLKEKEAANWINFDVLEPEKLEWTKNVEKHVKSLKAGESFEARFDWKGFLQPYKPEEKDENKDNRELYLHGEDPQRPGYTLQEFFRLGRANVLQQRISAINAIAGIINLYNQGFYDGVIELPMSKTFFFLRFALDENVPGIVEAASRAMGFLFYNETDETLLDMVTETRFGFVQPVLDNRKASVAGTSQDEVENDLETTLRNLRLQEGDGKVEDLLVDEKNERETYSDYHLAEVNIVECLMRTDILTRISYILTVNNPSYITISSCTKILIRLARSSRENAQKILNCNNFLEYMVNHFLTAPKPYYLVLKLFRILSSYDIMFCKKVMSLNVAEIAKYFVKNRKDTEVSLLKFQIECFRFLRLCYQLFLDTNFNELVIPVSYFLGWHFDNMDFKLDNHFIIRTHATALMYLIHSGDIVVTSPAFREKFKMCASKWFANATRFGAPDISQKILLSSVLEVATKFVKFNSEFFFDFVDGYLLKFMNSSTYKKITQNLCFSSPMFKSCEDRCNAHRALINLGAIVRPYKSFVPTLVLTPEYPIHLMESLITFIDAFDNETHARNGDHHRNLCGLFFTEDVEKYLETFASHFNRSLSANWFLKIELSFLFNLINSRSLQFNSSLLKVAFNLLNCLTKEHAQRIILIFKRFIFNDRFYYAIQVTHAELKRWQFIYNGLVVSRFREGEERQRNVAVAESWNQIVLNETWPYSLLMLLLYRAEVDAENRKEVETDLSDEEIITSTLKFTLLLEKNKVSTISTNQQLMYLMVVYFGRDEVFLIPGVKQLIKEKLNSMRHFTFPPRFNLKLNKEKSFESLYSMFLDTFQSSGYCDNVFSVLVMIPLAQKYDVKWRKLVWSEHVITMKFIECSEEDLFGKFDDYLYPLETDVSLLKSYAHAISSNILRKDSIPWRIATHHLKNAKKV